MHALQTFLGNVRIYLRCRKITVTEQQLNHAQVCPVIEQVGRKRMTQHVG